MKDKTICGILALVIFASISSVPLAEAKPIKLSETLNDLIIMSCSVNKGVLSCTLSSVSGKKIGPVLMTDPNGNPPLCDLDDSMKKRPSVTNRNSENCPHPFVEDSTLRITVQGINGLNNLQVDVTNRGSYLEFDSRLIEASFA